MLAYTLAVPSVPASNLRRDVLRTSWLLLVHDLEIRFAVVLGWPDDETLHALVDLVDELHIAGTAPDGFTLPDPGQGRARVTVARRDEPWGRDPDLLVCIDPSASGDVGAHVLTRGAVERSTYWAPGAAPSAGTPPVAWLVPATDVGPTQVVADAPGAIALPFGARSGNRFLDRVEVVRRVASRLEARARHSLWRERGGARPRRRGDPDRGVSALAMSTGPVPTRTAQPALLLRHPSQRPQALPRWIEAMAADAGLHLGGRPWTLNADGDYRSQKVLFLVGRQDDPGGVLAIKVTRDPRFSARLENEHRSLEVLAAHDVASVPRPVFRGRHRDLAVVGETGMAGDAFSSVSDATPACPQLARAVRWATGLALDPTLRGVATADEAGSAARQVASALAVTCAPSAAVREMLEHDAFEVGAQPVATVFMHGDLGTWNILVTPSGLSVLDWENGDPRGAPLWDVAYLVLTHAMRSAAATGRRYPPARAALDLSGGAWRTVLDESLEPQRDALDIAPALVDPLLRLGWAHLAVKGATRLRSGAGATGFYARLLEALCAAPRQRSRGA